MRTVFDEQIEQSPASNGISDRQRAFLAFGTESGGPGTAELTHLRQMEASGGSRWWARLALSAWLGRQASKPRG
jgi:hypothetical protein